MGERLWSKKHGIWSRENNVLLLCYSCFFH